MVVGFVYVGSLMCGVLFFYGVNGIVEYCVNLYLSVGV